MMAKNLQKYRAIEIVRELLGTFFSTRSSISFPSWTLSFKHVDLSSDIVGNFTLLQLVYLIQPESSPFKLWQSDVQVTSLIALQI